MVRRKFILLTCIGSLFFVRAEAAVTASLKQEQVFQLVANGKRVGEVRVPAGAAVAVVSESGDNVLVSRSALASAWVPRSALQMDTPEPDTASSSTPETVPEKDSGVLARGKEALSNLKNTVASIAKGPMEASGKDVADSVQSAVAIAKASGAATLAELGRPHNDTDVTPSSVFNSVPADFHYEKTVIVPGIFVFLSLPFEKQMLKGVCAAASVLNIVRYMEPTIDLNQEEMFGLYNNLSLIHI